MIKKISLPKIIDDGWLIFGEEKTHLPFKVKRIFYILQPKPGLPRGYHAHRKTKQLIFCLQGSVKVIIDDRRTRKEVVLDKPEEGLFLDRMIWYEQHDFKKNTVLLVLASEPYREDDYIRDYFEYRRLVNEKRHSKNKPR